MVMANSLVKITFTFVI